MGHYNHSILVDAKIMVSTNCPIIGEQVAVNFRKFKVALNPNHRIFLNFAKIASYHVNYNSIIKNGVTKLVFEL